MKDYIVRVWIPLSVRVENVEDASDADGMAQDYLLRDPVTGESVEARIKEALDPTAFFPFTAKPRFEVVGPADDI